MRLHASGRPWRCSRRSSCQPHSLKQVSDDERPPSGPWLPEHLRGLTQETATDEQRAEIRAALRQRRADLDAYWTPERRAKRRAEFDALLARNQEIVNARGAAEAADPSLFWARRGREEARGAVFRERYLPLEARDTYRAAFDAALVEEREKADRDRPAKAS
jgi:hypothetical protein